MAIEPLHSILAARDGRSLLRKHFAQRGLSSLSLNINVPGFPKSNEAAKRFFRCCLYDLRYYLRSQNIMLDEPGAVEQTDEAGDFFIAAFTSGMPSNVDIKKLCEDFEEKHPWGRFIDIDITDQDGHPVSSGKAKLCYYCGQWPADVCRRENRHDLNDLRTFMFSAMEKFCNLRRENEICRTISSLALKAILQEISLTPKPGLVDRLSNGSHTDMKFQTFMDSTTAISAYFVDLVQAGFAYGDKDLALALPVVRNIGLQMETAMYACTNRINTQKGIVFLMGLSLFAVGYLFACGDKFAVKRFREIIRQICKDLTRKELENNSHPEKTHGEEIYRRYRLAGARGEAEKGFPMVFDFGLPALLRHEELNDEALIMAFLSIAAHNDDTNIVYRSNLTTLEKFKSLSYKALRNYDGKRYKALMEYCRNENISPGGSADLLALSIFMYSVIKESDHFKFINY